MVECMERYDFISEDLGDVFERFLVGARREACVDYFVCPVQDHAACPFQIFFIIFEIGQVDDIGHQIFLPHLLDHVCPFFCSPVWCKERIDYYPSVLMCRYPVVGEQCIRFCRTHRIHDGDDVYLVFHEHFAHFLPLPLGVISGDALVLIQVVLKYV